MAFVKLPESALESKEKGLKLGATGFQRPWQFGRQAGRFVVEGIEESRNKTRFALQAECLLFLGQRCLQVAH